MIQKMEISILDVISSFSGNFGEFLGLGCTQEEMLTYEIWKSMTEK